MLARKVTLNPTPYEEEELFWRKSDFNILQENTAWVYLLRLYVFFIIADLLATRDREKDSAVTIRRFERNFGNFSRVLHIFL